MGSDRVGELALVLDLVDRDEHLRRDLLVELDVLLELGDDRAGERLDLLALVVAVGDGLGIGLEELGVLGIVGDAGALATLDQHFHGAVGQLQELQHGADGADGIDVFGLRIVLGGILLGREKDLLVVLHHILERTHGFLSADEQRHDHMREHDDVTQRQYGVERRAIDFVHKDLNDCTLGSRPEPRQAAALWHTARARCCLDGTFNKFFKVGRGQAPAPTSSRRSE